MKKFETWWLYPRSGLYIADTELYKHYEGDKRVKRAIEKKAYDIAVKALEYYAQKWYLPDCELMAIKARKTLKELGEL